MISKTLKLISLLAMAATVVILTVFSIWDVPVKQHEVNIEIDASKFTK